MKNKLILCSFVVLLFVCASCGGSEATTGISFEVAGKSYVWAKGESGKFSEEAIALQTEKGGVFRLNMIACSEILKSGANSSDNVISLGIKKNSAAWAGKNQGLVILWLEGKQHIGSADIEIAKFGKVDEFVMGKFSGTAGEIEVKGMFNLRRIEDKALDEGNTTSSSNT